MNFKKLTTNTTYKGFNIKTLQFESVLFQVTTAYADGGMTEEQADESFDSVEDAIAEGKRIIDNLLKGNG